MMRKTGWTKRWHLKLAFVALPAALLVSACMPEGMRVPQSEFLAALERKSGMIAYLGADGNIYTIDQGGGEPTPVTSDARSDSSGYHFYGLPAWSPDSQSLAFVAYTGQSGEAPSSMSLFTANRDGAALTEAHTSENYVIYYGWSPDSSRLGFLSETPGRNLALNVIRPDGSEAETVDAGAPYYWAWAPDSRSMVVHVGGASPTPQAHISVLQLEPDVAEFSLDVRPAEFKAPAYSPDGRSVLIAAHTEDGQPALLLTGVVESEPKTIVEYPEGGNIAFAWSPDGKRIAYVITDSPNLGEPGRLAVADPSGKKKPIEMQDELVHGFFWSPDSESVAYFTDLPPAPEEEGTPAPGEEAAEVSEDITLWQLKVLDVSSGKARRVAAFVPTERFIEVLPYFDQYHHSTTIWSPDSTNLVISAYRGDGTPGIWVAAASGNLDPRYIADGWVGFWSWR